MKKNLLLSFCLFTIAATILLSDCRCGNNGSNMITVPTNVSFGSQGACVGAGLCKCTVKKLSDPTQLGMVPATFSVDPNDLTKLLMNIKVQDIQGQPNLMQAFMPPAASYQFPLAVPLNSLFPDFNLPPNSSILPNCHNVLKMSADNTTITDTISISSTSYSTVYIMFGATNQDGSCDNTRPGIFQFSPGLADGGAPDGFIPVTFMNNPNVPQGLLMTFSFAALQQLQQAQANLFPGQQPGPLVAATSDIPYTFTSLFKLDDGVFMNRLQLQGPTPNIPALTTGRAKVSGDIVTITVTYVAAQ